MADNYKQLSDSAENINRKLTRDPEQDEELRVLQETKVTNIKLSLAELDALNNETYLMNTYKAREVSGWLTQGAYVVGRFYHHVDCSSKKGFVQVIISNYVVEEDGTINSAALSTSDTMQTTIAERKCAINGEWSKWVKLSDEIDKKLATLGSEISGVTELEINRLNFDNFSLNSGGSWVQSGKYSHYVLADNAISEIVVTAQETIGSRVFFTNTKLPASELTPEQVRPYLCNPDATYIVVAAGQERTIPVPPTATYLYISKETASGVNFEPLSIELQKKDSINGQLTEIKSNIKELDNKLSGVTNLDVSGLEYDNFSLNSGGSWLQTGKYSHYELKDNAINEIVVTAQASIGSRVFFTNTKLPASELTPEQVKSYLCSPDTTYIVVAAGQERTISVPSTATYLYISKETESGVNYEPLSISLMSKDSLANKTKLINDINLELNGGKLDISRQFSFSTGAIFADGTFNPTTTVNSATVDYIDIEPYVGSILKIAMTKYVAPPSNAVGLCFYDKNKNLVSFVGCNSDSELDAAVPEERTITIPQNAVYLRTTILTRLVPNFTCRIEKIGIKDSVANIEKKLDNVSVGLTHETPKNIGVLNAIKRARQLTDVKWTPIRDIPRLCSVTRDYSVESDYYEGVFKAGVEYKGVPYGRAEQGIHQYGYTDGRVGQIISIDTFVTSVQNEDTAYNEISSWHPDNHDPAFYAVVCNGLVGYAIGLTNIYATSQFESINGLTKIANVKDIDVNSLQLCDIILRPAHHVAIITDIIRDADGNIKYVEVSEATTAGAGDKDKNGYEEGGVCRRKGWSIADFVHWFYEGYGIYRYAYISQVTYTPSVFVNVGDEFDMMNYPRMACIPYMGERFVYKRGYIPNTDIVVESSDFTHLRVFKDGVRWNADGTTNPYLINGKKVSVGFSAVGKYEAYLCKISGGNDTISSIKCHWEVI